LRWWLLAAAIFTAFGFLITGICFPEPALTIYNGTKDKLMYKASSNEVLDIHFKYQQSYDRGIIEEFFILKDNKIIPTLMIYDTDSYDYHGSRYKNAVYEVKDERYYIYIREHTGYPEIRYRVGHTIEQKIRITTNNGVKTMLFQDVGDPGDLLIITQFRR
jgi:hypothetical protein